MIMGFLVTRRGGGGNLVTPSGQTPNGVLHLSVIDSLAVLRCNARTLHVFKGGDATVIRDAFSKALVPYYPLAGRLKMSPHSNNQLLQIDCSAQGIWFEEASADCTLYDVNYLDEAAALEDSTFDKLLPQLHSSSPHPIGHDTFMDPLVLVQVTEFKCGGFVMGLTFCHIICDGLGAAQFLKAVGEFARGVEKLSATPVWCREYLLPTPSAQKGLIASDHETKDNSSMSPPFIIPVPDQRLEHASFDIPIDEINQLKHKVMQDQLMDRQNAFCSSFEIIAATLWKQRTRAILDLTNDEKNSSSSSNSSFITTDNAGDDEVKLVFFANCRQLVPLPDGFYGNCFFPVTVKASNKIVAQASLAEVVKLIKDAKAKLPAEFSQWLNNKTYKSVNEDQNDPFAPGPGVGYDTLFISEWGRLGFNEVDYGWGKPVHVIPVQGSAVIPVGIVTSPPVPAPPRSRPPPEFFQGAIMAFIKVQKTRAYFKRFQVKFKRRREGKTDYRARNRLINQDKNKYNTPKYRLVVRFTNKDIIAQIVSASIAGDMILASAYANELPRYGLEVGLTNYAAAYCTGLLLARRVLKKLEMDEEYQGNLEVNGEDYSVEPAESRRPFRALLDVGLIRTTTGNRVFGALKGALDGGLDIPHSEKRFAGFSKDSKQLDADVHRNYIYGGHVATYMKTLIEDEPEKYQSHFSEYIKKGLEADHLEEMYKKVHAAIRADPTFKKSDKHPPKQHKRYNLKKLTYEERKAKLIERLNALNSAAGNDDDDDEDDE